MATPMLNVLRIKDSEGNIVVEVSSRRDIKLLGELLRSLGVTVAGGKRERFIEFNEMFMEYLIKDRGQQEKTAKCYMNYLRRLDGKPLTYGTFLEISGSRWMVKCVRLYIDFLEKSGEISEDEAERLRKIFKIRSGAKIIKKYHIEYSKIIEVLERVEVGTLYWLVLRVLYFSGARLSEVVKMIQDFDERELTCFQDRGFCRYYLVWSRGKKRCEWIYFPATLTEYLKMWRGKIGKYDTVRDTLYDYYGVKVKDFRKLFYRVCRDVGVEGAICDFYQSRISGLSIGDLHYDDIVTRADKQYTELAARLSKLLERGSS
ncbi:MAG: integrase [Sulfolobales archaeon]